MNNLRLYIFLILAIPFISGIASAQQKHVLRFDPFTVEFNNQSFESISISGPKSKDLTPFEVENPRRLVLDLPRKIGKFLKEANYILNNSVCSNSIRIGGHPDKTRVVIDLKNNCDFLITKKSDSLLIKFVTVNQVLQTPVPVVILNIPSPTASTTAIATFTATAKAPTTVPPTLPASVQNVDATPTFTVTPSPTHSATFTATPTLTALPTVAEKTATATDSKLSTTPTAIPTLIIPTALDGRVLDQINFFHDGDINQVKLNFSQRVSFKTVKESPRKYKISIKDCLLARPGLSLPQFPPNDVVGFTLIQPVKVANGVDIFINVEDGIRINATNIDNTIVITAEAAGF